jgi:hypothetical protein
LAAAHNMTISQWLDVPRVDRQYMAAKYLIDNFINALNRYNQKLETDKKKKR